jgi:AcrR family transcriptional regulator
MNPMLPGTSATSTVPANPEPAGLPESRFDRRLSEIIDYAAQVFADKGYEGASMRDLSRLSGTSLAGLYYYFECKEKLLYYIQKHTFESILDRLRQRLSGAATPEERIRIFILNHVEYSVERPAAMKVLAHEDDVLKDGYGSELARIKRQYYRVCFAMVGDFLYQEGLGNAGFATRTAVMTLFGAMNWLYTWYNPKLDPPPAELARQMAALFLQGARGTPAHGAGVPAHARESSKPKRLARPAYRPARARKNS